MVFFDSNYRKLLIIWALVLSLLITSGTAFGAILVYESFASTNNSKTEIVGDTLGEQFGSIVVSGDVNHDGTDDLIIGSPFSSIGDSEWNGKASVFFGKKKTDIGTNNLNPLKPDVVFYGAYSGDQLGSAITVGDVNGDKIDDVIIPTMVTYHPAYLLKTPLQKKAVWSDMLMLQDKIQNLAVTD